MKKLFALSAIALAVAGCSDDTLPEEVGNSFGQLEISGTAEVGQTLTATVTDGNGVDASAINYTWSANGTAISGATSSTYTVTEAEAGASITVSVSYTDNDSFAETITSNGLSVLNNEAVFSGDVAASVEKDETVALTGSVAVADPDGADTVVAQTDVATMYGTFSIAADGSWTYTLDVANTTVAGLAGDADTLVDSVSIEAADGTRSSIEITVTGTAANTVAEIKDEDTGDTGELVWVFGPDNSVGYTEGKFSVRVLYSADETETAYISLFDSGNSTSSLIADLQLNEGALSLRGDTLGADDFTPGQWMDIEMTWNTSSTTDAGTYTVSIDGTSYGPFTSQNTTPGVEVTAVTVKLASNGKTSADSIYVDDFFVYSDEAGTTQIVDQDFDDKTSGDPIDSDDGFGSRTFGVTALTLGGGDSGDTGGDNGGDNGGDTGNNGDLGEGDVAPGTSGNKVAEITDTLDSDAGELRIKFSDSQFDLGQIAKGKLTVSFNKNDSCVAAEDGNTKEAYIALYGGSTSTYNAIADLRINSDEYDYKIRRNRDVEDTRPTPDTTAASFAANTWHHVVMTWDATTANVATEGPTVSTTIDGTAFNPESWATYSESVSDVTGGASYVVFKLSDTSRTVPDCKYRVDNIKIYSTDASDVDTLEYSQNFEGFDVDVNLADSFSSSTVDAAVKAED